jgi:hypothetical protein
MQKRELEVGDIVQIDPEKHDFGGCLMIVTEPKEWGAQGYLLMDKEITGLCRFMGQAYIRLTWEKMEYVGHAEWISVPKPDSTIQD